jgi:hypothetical protein
MHEREKPSYLDENLTEKDREEVRTRVPTPEQEGSGRGKDPRPMSPKRPDDAGDGDRRS